VWTCPKCNARVDPSFDVCWRCGTTEEGDEDPDFVTADEAEPISLPTDYLQLDPGKLPESELPDAPLDLVACFEGTSLLEVKFVADQLVAAGIPATIQDMGYTTRSLLAHVVVRAEDLARARPIIEEFVEHKRAREARGD
jgi:hypothetical protein